MDIHQIYCVAEGGWVTKYSTVYLTECPNDALHEINPDSSSISQETHGLVYTSSKTTEVVNPFYTLYYTIKLLKPISSINLLSNSNLFIKVVNYTKRLTLLEQEVTTNNFTYECLCFDVNDIIEVSAKTNSKSSIYELSFNL